MNGDVKVRILLHAFSGVLQENLDVISLNHHKKAKCLAIKAKCALRL
jgi:hypothetical protein